MSQEFAISVIIPVFNAASYLDACVHSLMHQTIVDEIEYIFIDDGSTDDSLTKLRKIVSEYPSREKQVRIIEFDEHQGVTEARSIGILEAKGEYIGWCDADDWVAPEMYSTMLNATKKWDAEIVCCNYYVSDTDGCISEVHHQYPSKGKTYLRNLYRKWSIDDAILWNKIFRRSFLMDHQVLPIKGINWGEDFNFCVQSFYYADHVVTVPECLYYYRVHKDSLSNSTDWWPRWKDGMANLDYVCGFLKTKPDARDYRYSCSFLKFTDKHKFRHLYKEDSLSYYQLYKESYNHIVHFTAYPLSLRIKWMIIFSSPLIYIIYKRFRKY